MASSQTITEPSILYVGSEDFAFLSHRLPMARAARDAGFDIHVATRVDAGRADIEAEGFTLHSIPFRRGRLSLWSALRTIWALRKLRRRLKPDIVHNAGLQACILGAAANLGTGQAQVHAMTGLGYTFTSDSLLARGLRPFIAALLRFLLGGSASVVLVQNPDDRRALEEIGIASEKITLIPGSGVDVDALTPMPEPSGPITVGFAGRLLVDKGIRALVDAHRKLREKNHDIQLLIAGRTDLANPASLSDDEVATWHDIPGLTLLGQISDISDLWRKSHIAALPSHREGLPKSLLEAAACGRPLVATDAPGCREVVIEGQTGLLVPIEDSDALAISITELAASLSLRARLGAAARKLVEDRMSAQAIGAATVALYRELIAVRRRNTSNENQGGEPGGQVRVVSPPDHQ